ncbi:MULTISPECIES: hypothetical protein [Bacillus cereus group]|uniref:hypothetical protein n=1 Tax=Bacillus cereus group TaxID=86661 RepID=UPI000BEB9A64|nr:hypothetical protein [Bacillus cereus]HDR6827956.1 hypothetical protein [Bacillus thuringiensis]PDY55397.1 hypothetical protein COM88_32940 [Bacillus cereus]PGQ56263.1 hypothetical protein COA26_27980 [Bacillus cereus]HDR6834353.1 hypothetical protein [Bacillus thuringiensis]HDR6860229.1 hypothetical protein [Bacillus thuringiensis]
MSVYVYSLNNSIGIVYEENEYLAELTVAEFYSTNSDEVDIKLKEITSLEELREYTSEPGEVIAFL